MEQQKTRQNDGTADGTTVLTNIIMKHGPFSRRGQSNGRSIGVKEQGINEGEINWNWKN